MEVGLIIFLLIFGAYVASLLYANAKIGPMGENPSQDSQEGTNHSIEQLGSTVSVMGIIILGTLLLLLLSFAFTVVFDLFPR